MTTTESAGLLWVVACLLLFAGCGDEQEQAPSEAPSSTVPSDTVVADTAGADSATPSPPPDTVASSTEAASTTADSSSPSTALTGPLTDAQRDRIGPTLRRLLRGDSRSLDEVEPVDTRDGEPVYSVTVECDDAAALRAAGVPLTSVQGPIITARWTLDQIRTAAAVGAVNMIRADAPVRPHSTSPNAPKPGQSMGPASPPADSA